jgi:hypothetical protein
VDKSFANGGGPNGTGIGSKPAEVTASETTFWLLVNQDPRAFAS